MGIVTRQNPSSETLVSGVSAITCRTSLPRSPPQGVGFAADFGGSVGFSISPLPLVAQRQATQHSNAADGLACDPVPPTPLSRRPYGAERPFPERVLLAWAAADSYVMQCRMRAGAAVQRTAHSEGRSRSRGKNGDWHMRRRTESRDLCHFARPSGSRSTSIDNQQQCGTKPLKYRFRTEAGRASPTQGWPASATVG